MVLISAGDVILWLAFTNASASSTIAFRLGLFFPPDRPAQMQWSKFTSVTCHSPSACLHPRTNTGHADDPFTPCTTMIAHVQRCSLDFPPETPAYPLCSDGYPPSCCVERLSGSQRISQKCSNHPLPPTTPYLFRNDFLT